MRFRTTISALLAPAIAQAQWWGGAPNCAHSCFSSFFTSATDWPSPSNYCDSSQGASVSSCLSSACSATPTAQTSYSSLSSSLCSRWASCSSAGSTGVFTATFPTITGHHGGPWGNGDGPWTGGPYTVTGCEWDGSPWAGGPGGWGPGGRGGGGGPWGQWGNEWSWATRTTTVTVVVTSDGSVATTVGPATVAVAASGDVRSTTTLGIVGAEQSAPTASDGDGNKNAGPRVAGDVGVKAVGAVLGGVVAVVAML
ncbi:hypothetical protein QBC33DRAFT_606220 [Phialemonium atrogriseum]|uniref:Extracellular membrane protein CFEM domain-containing protein n=1 Tax=Phialemonium atrogriseum TaxID=1093897 RepID=A0AAJ0C2N0_9PEZI|nr:uncharacterized protein QBC33DRAFT_606220 [Phialemonium atrogriseum]KAK1768796.1 hypothetical protein QBC33DRAFT_606220 [Phialemonium atrogriseum]